MGHIHSEWLLSSALEEMIKNGKTRIAKLMEKNLFDLQWSADEPYSSIIRSSAPKNKNNKIPLSKNGCMQHFLSSIIILIKFGMFFVFVPSFNHEKFLLLNIKNLSKIDLYHFFCIVVNSLK